MRFERRYLYSALPPIFLYEGEESIRLLSHVLGSSKNVANWNVTGDLFPALVFFYSSTAWKKDARKMLNFCFFCFRRRRRKKGKKFVWDRKQNKFEQLWFVVTSITTPRQVWSGLLRACCFPYSYASSNPGSQPPWFRDKHLEKKKKRWSRWMGLLFLPPRGHRQIAFVIKRSIAWRKEWMDLAVIDHTRRWRKNVWIW